MVWGRAGGGEAGSGRHERGVTANGFLVEVTENVLKLVVMAA